jgi:hypothetical protein
MSFVRGRLSQAGGVPLKSDPPIILLVRWESRLCTHRGTSPFVTHTAMNMKQAEPLHLLASLFDQESERSSQIVKQVGVSKEAVIAELRSS